MNRAVALKWWVKQANISRGLYYGWYTLEHFTPAKDYTQLTGREIEIIWNKFKTISTP